MQQAETGLSVVVCTYNRVELLKGALQSLVSQTVNKSLYEVLIVDNNSTDQTENIVCRISGMYPNFRYIKEPKQGLSYARNRGFKEARYKYVAYIDDDARASPEWVEKILTAFNTIKPMPLVVGGEIHPWYETAPPAWFTDDFEIRTWGSEKGFLQPPRAQYGFSGSNMAFKKEVFEKYNGFSPDFGIVGDALRLGEEAALFYRIYQDHPFFWYDPEIKVEHWVPAKNMKVSYRLKRAYVGGVTIAGITGSSVFTILTTIMSLSFRISTLPLRVRWWEKYWQRSFLKHTQPIAWSMGFLRSSLFGM